MASTEKNYGKAVSWILLSPLLLLMALISTVESLTTYYIQLAIFGAATLIGMATGVGYVFGWPWASVSEKYMLWAVAICFIGIPLSIVLFILFKIIAG